MLPDRVSSGGIISLIISLRGQNLSKFVTSEDNVNLLFILNVTKHDAVFILLSDKFTKCFVKCQNKPLRLS